MAYPIKFPEANAVLQKPANMTYEECRPLPILRKDGQCISVWELSPEELANINITHSVVVGVLSGKTQPPIWVQGAAPDEGTDIEGGRALQMSHTYEIGTLGLKLYFYSDESDQIEVGRARQLEQRLRAVLDEFGAVRC